MIKAKRNFIDETILGRLSSFAVIKVKILSQMFSVLCLKQYLFELYDKFLNESPELRKKNII